VEVAGQPFIAHQLRLLRAAGVARVVVCAGHLGEQIADFVGDGGRYHLEIAYSYDGQQPLGTGGALRRALPLLGERFLTLYGDSYLDCDYMAVERSFLASGKLGLMTVLANYGRWDRSNVVYRDGVIRVYNKKGTPSLADGPMTHIDYGLGAFSREALMEQPTGVPFDLADVYGELCARGELAAYEVKRRFYEIGSISGLTETRALLGNAPPLENNA
jgi:NDP-sugar pyrophosphorylase family protein